MVEINFKSYKSFGIVKVLGLDANLFRIYYRESPEVYEILDNHIKYSKHDADEDLFYLTFNNFSPIKIQQALLKIHKLLFAFLFFHLQLFHLLLQD